MWVCAMAKCTSLYAQTGNTAARESLARMPVLHQNLQLHLRATWKLPSTEALHLLSFSNAAAISTSLLTFPLASSLTCERIPYMKDLTFWRALRCALACKVPKKFFFFFPTPLGILFRTRIIRCTKTKVAKGSLVVCRLP